MRGWIIIGAFFGGIFALCWYGATGETGPMGWLNSWQNQNTGSYSRGLSFGVLCVAGVVIAAPLMGAWAIVTRNARARTGALPTAITAPADARIAAMAVAMNDRDRWRWRMYLSIWAVGLVLIVAGVLGGFGWDFHRRAADAGSDYTPLRLERTTSMASPGAGSHLALQGRLLWDHSATQTTKGSYSKAETAYVPVAGADWRPGDAIQFVLRLSREQVWALRQRTDASDAPLLVRVDGAIPTPSRAVFQRAEAPPVDDAVIVEEVDSSAGQVRDAHPTFDWDNAKVVTLAIAATWTSGIGLGAFAVLLKVLRNRRRRARQIG